MLSPAALIVAALFATATNATARAALRRYITAKSAFAYNEINNGAAMLLPINATHRYNVASAR